MRSRLKSRVLRLKLRIEIVKILFQSRAFRKIAKPDGELCSIARCETTDRTAEMIRLLAEGLLRLSRKGVTILQPKAEINDVALVPHFSAPVTRDCNCLSKISSAERRAGGDSWDEVDNGR